MQRLELPASELKKLISSEDASSIWYKLVHASVWLAVIGVAGFFVAFFYQKTILAAGLSYRTFQAGAILVVFIGWILFMVFCSRLGISTRKLTYRKLMCILKNQAETDDDIIDAIRRQTGLALANLDDQWSLYPSIFIADQKKTIPMVLVGPAGIYPMQVIYQDPRKKEFVDPLPVLKAGSAELEKQLKTPVKPVIAFLRNNKHYHCPDESIKTFTTSELYAYVTSREEKLDPADLSQVHIQMRRLANLPA